MNFNFIVEIRSGNRIELVFFVNIVIVMMGVEDMLIVREWEGIFF